MNELLLSEITSKQTDLLSTLMLVEKFVFGQQNYAFSDIEAIIAACDDELSDKDDALERAELLINFLFVDLLFIDNETDSWPAVAFQLQKGIHNRLLAPSIKAILLSHIISQCGMTSDLVFIPEKIMVRILCDEQYAIIFDPVTGESLHWQEFDARMAELDGDPTKNVITAMTCEAVIMDYLRACKVALIHENCFDKALKCVDGLLALKPDDPFERRDRGFLLHQLDCFKVAYDDYQYFVQQCPKDPAAQLLKLQLEQIAVQDTILH